jgi:hypothetical protein
VVVAPSVKVAKAKGAVDWAEFYANSIKKLANPYDSLRIDKLEFSAAEYQAEIGNIKDFETWVSFFFFFFSDNQLIFSTGQGSGNSSAETREGRSWKGGVRRGREGRQANHLHVNCMLGGRWS